jgi:hypothetical protein
MNTPTPRTEEAVRRHRLLGCGPFELDGRFADFARILETELAAITAERDQLRAEVERVNALGSWAHTCIHHNDEQRAKAKGCPVCATAERDQLAEARQRETVAIASWDEERGRALREGARVVEWRDRAERAEAEVERLGSDRDCEKRLRKDADEFRENAIERATKAEADLAALEQCHDDNCRAVVAIAGDLAIEREKSERYRLVTLRQDAELATERARLDWVFRNCKVTSDGYPVHDREDLGVAMKEDAK